MLRYSQVVTISLGLILAPLLASSSSLTTSSRKHARTSSSVFSTSTLSVNNFLVSSTTTNFPTFPLTDAATGGINATSDEEAEDYNVDGTVLPEVDTSTVVTDAAATPNFKTTKAPTFQISPDLASPHNTLEIRFNFSDGFDHFRANFTDLSAAAADGSHIPPASYTLSESPFRLRNLLPGHQYKFEIYGFHSDDEYPELLHTEVAGTNPLVPRFNPEEIIVTQNSITLHGLKDPDAEEDYYVIRCMQLDAPSRTLPLLNITSVRESLTLEFLIGGLNAGTTYNVVVTAYKFGRASQPWSMVLTTEPSQPTGLSIKEKGMHNVVLKWSVPANSSVDSFHLVYQELVSRISKEETVSSQVNEFKILHLLPGSTYQIFLSSYKNGKNSSAASLYATTKPLPPINLTILPDYATARFRVLVLVPSRDASSFSRCRLEMTSLTTGGQVITNDSSALPSNGVCEFLPSDLQPGDLYRLRAWTISTFNADGENERFAEETLSTEVKIERNVAPAYDAVQFGIAVITYPSAIKITWDHAIVRFWRHLIGQKGSLGARLRDPSAGEKAIETLMSSPLDKNGNKTDIVFDRLTAGSCYLLEIYTTVAGVLSENRSQIPVRTDAAITVVTHRNLAATSVELAITFSSGDRLAADDSATDASVVTMDKSCRLSLQLENAEQRSVVANWDIDGLQLQQRPMLLTVNKLAPYRFYNVSGHQECSNSRSQCPVSRFSVESHTFRTLESLPGAVRNVIATEANNSSNILLTWLPPADPNGIILSYLISCTPEQLSGESPWNVTTSGQSLSFTFDNLTGGIEYRVEIRARTALGLSPDLAKGQSVVQVSTKLRRPPLLDEKEKPTIDATSAIHERQLTIRFALHKMFSRKTTSGFLHKFAIIVAEGDNVLSSEPTSLSWNDVQSSSDVWPPYISYMRLLSDVQRTKQQPELSDVRSLVIGSDAECFKSSSDKRYCNGPLRPGRRYRVKVRAYTADDLYTDSVYSDPMATEAESNATAGTIVAVVVVLIVSMIVLLCVTLFIRNRGGVSFPLLRTLKAGAAAGTNGFLSRRRSAGNGAVANGGGRVLHHGLSAPVGSGHANGRLDPSLLDTTRLERVHHLPPVQTIMPNADREKNRPVRKICFSEHVFLMSSDTDLRFSEEFEDLKQVGRSQSCIAADLPANRAKNRFTNILPYDVSRVKLKMIDDEEGSDYINANYIPGYNSPREFIAAQGCLPSTRDDFWRMIWEQGCHAIVNLTRCIERGREKCDMYWPSDTDPVFYGDIQVTLLNESRNPEWSVREFKVAFGDQVRNVLQFQYTSWPDFGVPERPQSLLKFVRTFRSRVSAKDSPVVVHCSAGVGRSGTFIALDRLLQQMMAHDYLDVFSVVYEMRKHRVLMVQTEQQYICIHQCLLHVIEGKEMDSASYSLPFAEVHENPVFDDDEGIDAESGL